MIKHALVVSVLSAGMVIAGSALAQPPESPPAGPMTQYRTAGSYDNNGYGADWQSNADGMQWPNATRGDAFTFALNDLYAHGFHAVHRLWMGEGGVHAFVVTPNGVRQQVTVQAGSGRISLG